MPPKKRFSREQIIDTAFEIAKVEGIDAITIRKVAEKMGSSIAPIYVNFKDVDELIQEVIKKTFHKSRQILMEQNTGSPFRDMGIASLRFAKEYSVLFRDLVMKQNDYMKRYDQELGNDLVEQMKKDSDLEGFTDEELMDILLKMRIFQTGLSVMVANGLLPEDFTEEKVTEILESTATDIMDAARLRKEAIYNDHQRK
ncbi:AcrR family transcriptional regulator [Caldalkalibacillus uzonensis]|uniref:AcrR family transcriptional regulator n=1 Tax=Caldalkalibacillus uzonensis TaxID=353224 RepID=A0ABU0CQY7_9BACI|nr:TetR/AcrR family transcriptional regulator [Caldalkalibacillus uzonensis]MDQ0337427.1 AcrR family transcriptional regulator [Caldalkalibacillus uzonensis]